MNFTKGKWTSERVAFGHNINAATSQLPVALVNLKSDAALIVAAVNACQEVNPENPLAVAESIKEMYHALKEFQKISYSVEDENYDEVVMALDAADNAILKAEGR